MLVYLSGVLCTCGTESAFGACRGVCTCVRDLYLCGTHLVWLVALALYGISLYYYYNVGEGVCQGVWGGFVNFA